MDTKITNFRKYILLLLFISNRNLISTLMHNGINTTETLELTEKTINNTYIKREIQISQKSNQ